jgi:hypothetical protein
MKGCLSISTSSIDAGFVIHGYLGGRVLFTKALGLALSVSSGLSLGDYFCKLLLVHVC